MPARRRHQRARRARSPGKKAILPVHCCSGATIIRKSEMHPDAANQIVAYWLIPAEPALSHFRSLISELAGRFDAPVFEPHVTLYVTNADIENPTEALGRAAASFKPCRLSIAGVDFSDEFTKTLFVQFRPDLALARLSEDLRSASVSQREYQLNPHLSLIYKTISRETKEQIANSIRFPFTEVCFDSVKAIISPAEIKARKDVEAWQVVATQELTG